MTDKIVTIRLKEPINCPFRRVEQYPHISSEWMMFCGLKMGIVCSDPNTFCEACPLEDAE